MRRPRRSLLTIASLLLFACSAMTAEDRDWRFMQSVGGIAVHPLRRANGKVSLPVECDVSGARAITTKPTALNSGLVVREVRASREGDAIYLVVRTSLPSGGQRSSCPSVDLVDVPAGRYRVFYGNPPASFGKPAETMRIGEVDAEP